MCLASGGAQQNYTHNQSDRCSFFDLHDLLQQSRFSNIHLFCGAEYQVIAETDINVFAIVKITYCIDIMFQVIVLH